jgi:toxin ParE1/3/4
MKIRWAPAAKNDRAQIFSYIEARDPGAAIWMDELFMNAVSRLGYFPFMGKRGAVDGTREIIPHESYRIVYQVEDQTVSILMIVHTARQWPPRKR